MAIDIPALDLSMTLESKFQGSGKHYRKGIWRPKNVTTRKLLISSMTNRSNYSNSTKPTYAPRSLVMQLFNSRNIECYDELNNLRLFHYRKCDNFSSSDIKNSRGIIIRNNAVVCQSFNYTPEWPSTAEDIIRETLTPFFTDCSVYLAEEGTLLRLWFDNIDDKWRLSTHKRINAYTSYWGSKYSHGELFDQALEEISEKFYDSLPKDTVYVLWLCATEETRIVSDAKKQATVYHLAEYHYVNGKMRPKPLSINNTLLSKPPSLSFENVDAMIDYVNKLNYKEAQGIIAMHYYDENLDLYKITNTQYQELASLRGNHPDVLTSYLYLCQTSPDKIEQLMKLYPNENTEKYENMFNDTIDIIYDSYIKRFIDHEHIMMPKPQWYVARMLHEKY